MEFAVLGPVRVRAGDAVTPLTAPLPRRLLSLLVCHANAPVPVDVLVDAMWGGRPVSNASHNLHMHVHRLRQVLQDPARIVREDASYLLHVRPGELDAERFETLVAQAADAVSAGDPDRGAALVRDALALWRGQPYAGLDDVPLLRSEAERLAELRLVGLETLYGAEVACGRHAAILPELGQVAGQHPLREGLQELLVLTLYRAGRQADALETYRRTRDLLVEELGVEPGPRLAEAHAAVLAADPALETAAAAVSPALAQLPAAIADFTGRDEQLALVHSLVTAAGEDSTRPPAMPVVAIVGQPGVGKTTLAVRAAHQLSQVYRDGQLYVDLRGAEGVALDPAEALARFLRATGLSGSAIPDSLEERAAVYRSRLAGRQLLVVLDNAVGSGQVRPLLPGTPDCAVLVTSRARLTGLDGAVLVDLGLFEADQAVDLLARVAGPDRVEAEPSAARRLVDLCGLLPLAVRIAAARLAARPHWPVSRLAELLADERRRLDELTLDDLEVRASLALGYDELEPAAQAAFRRLGLLDAPDFAPWVVAALVDLSLPEAEHIADRLLDAQLLEAPRADPAGQTRYAFHDLVRLYARERAAEEPPEERDRALERAFGGLLALAVRADIRLQGTTPARVLEAAPPWQPDPVAFDELTADPAAWLESERVFLVAAVERAAATGNDRAAWKLAKALTFFLDVRGFLDDWRRIHETAIAATRRLGHRRAEGEMLVGLARLAHVRDLYDENTRLLEQAEAAFREAGDRRGDAEVSLQVGSSHRARGQFGDAQDHLERALATCRETGDRHTEARTLQELGVLCIDERRPADARPLLDRALVVFRVLGDRRLQALGLRWIAAADRRENQLIRAETRLTEAMAIFDDLRDRHNRAYVVRDLGEVYARRGRWPEAEALAEQCLEIFRQYGDRHGEARALYDLGASHRALSRCAEAIACGRHSLRIWQQLGVPVWQARTLRSLAESYAAAGDPEAASAARREADAASSEGASGTRSESGLEA